jgi:hypothetical protein
MTTTVTCLALLVAVTAAVRSTWSPCGLSMLSAITPFGERGRGHRYAATCAWFVLGAMLGGIVLGGLAAGLAAVVHAGGGSTVAIGSVALAATLIAAVSDSGLAGVRLPVHFRQVNERWLDAYRPWVYGAGFGFQIGCGLATYITSAAVYLTVVLAALTGSPALAVVVGATFGLVRGLAVTLTRRVRTPTQLLGFHQRFAGRRPWADRGVVAVTVASAVVLGVAVGPRSATVVVLVVAVAAGAAGAVRRSTQSVSAVSDEVVADTTASPVSPRPESSSLPPVDAAAGSTTGSATGSGTGSGRLSRQRW